jgi:hypothetical protein
MKVTVRFALVVLLLAWLTPQPPAAAVSIGQVDTFQDGTTQNWTINVLGLGSPAILPANAPTGGPAGAGDSYMQLTALGGAGGASRLSVINLSQWSGDYLTAGIGTITMDVNNLGSTDLFLRFLIRDSFDPLLGMSPNVALSTAAVVVPAGGGWMSVVFPINSADFTATAGSAAAALANVAELRLFHNPDVEFPPPPVVAFLGVDNIMAVPEPSAVLLLGLGIPGLARLRRRA